MEKQGQKLFRVRDKLWVALQGGDKLLYGKIRCAADLTLLQLRGSLRMKECNKCTSYTLFVPQSLKVENWHKSDPCSILGGTLLYKKNIPTFCIKAQRWTNLPCLELFTSAKIVFIWGSTNGFQTRHPLWKSRLNVEGIWKRVAYKVQLLYKHQFHACRLFSHWSLKF